MNEASNRLGCIECLPDGADEAWEAFGKSEIDARLIDDNHFIVLLRSCVSRGQRFLSVFTETIDWEHGEDPCCRTILPLTEQEALMLKTADREVVESLMYGLESNRQSLCREWPKGVEAKNFWSRGIKPHPHD